MNGKKILIGTNVCLDAAQKRKSFASAAGEILARSERKEFEGYISAHSIDTIFYLLQKYGTTKSAYKGLAGLLNTVQVAPVNQQIIQTSLALFWDDFEDAIHHQAAKAVGCEAIVTRNEKDFKNADLPVLSPHEFLEGMG